MENIIKITDCVEFKNELHIKLFNKSGVKSFDEYIDYINSIYSCKKSSSFETENQPLSVKDK